MAVSTNSYFSNALNSPQAGGEFSVHDVDTTPKFAVGHSISRNDGSSFVYGNFGVATNRGLIVSQDLSESTILDGANTIVAPGSSVSGDDGSVGSKFVEITGTATLDQLAGGYLQTIDETGEGYTYRIKTNTATGSPASGNYRVELYDKIQVAVAADTQAVLVGSLYANLEAATIAVDEVVAGVTMATMAAGEFGWVQTQGVATVLTTGTVLIGDNVIIGSTAGSVSPASAATSYAVGQVIVVGATTEHSSIKLKL